MWSFGPVETKSGKVYRFQVKHFKNGSQFGIDGGRVSKLWIAWTDDQGVCHVAANYDRGWDVKPEEGSEDWEAVTIVLGRYN